MVTFSEIVVSFNCDPGLEVRFQDPGHVKVELVPLPCSERFSFVFTLFPLKNMFGLVYILSN